MTGTYRTNRARLATTLGTIFLFAVMVLAVRWIVKSQRSPGAITVVEAQGMDMTAMKAPVGAQPVYAEPATNRQVGNVQSFPATVMAYSDEEIVARVPGKVLSLAYPGDNVRAGQVVANIDAQEYLAQQDQAVFSARASQSEARAAQGQVDLLAATEARTRADRAIAATAVAKAVADKDAAAEELQKMRAEADARKARAKAKAADLTYAEANLGRQTSIYQQGFSSADQFDLARRSRDMAKADLDDAQAEARAMDSSAAAAADRLSAAEKEVEQAKAQARSAERAITESAKAVEKARSDASASRAQAQAAASQATSASTIADYTQLRAFDDSMVADRFVSPGAVVTAGQKLLMLHNADRVRVQAQLPEGLAATVHLGTPVEIHYGDSLSKGRITSVFPTADSSTRTFTAEALIDNPGHRFLPGSFATMAVAASPLASQLAVKTSAIQSDSSGRTFVWVVVQSAQGEKTDWTCPMHTEVSEPGPGKCPICKMELVPRVRGGKSISVRRSVRTGDTDGSYTSVSGDLKLGDQVITAGAETLIEGSPVKVMSTATATVAPTEEQVPKTAKGALYTCPMHPQVVRDHPGRCPICGMELVRKRAGK